ncbi:hypothetical protein DPEC_G00321160 [Dallia pectoralis]|uniref:Uncharacterized protein n=1 Tax=Dallia pectoralis TaxID=75939 RepID=A0ACC2FA99_DALPE|nr:hypothetical protein DPEC_G00321160 [Dallia pectoralis]
MLRHFLTLLVLPGLVVNSSSSRSSSEEEKEHDDGSREKESNGHHSNGHGVPWGYKDQTAWTFNFTDCSGKSQSPIDINTRRAIYDPTLPPISLEGYDLTDDSALTLWNNGHTLELILPNTMRIVTGFDHEFLAAQLHFHWGTPEVPGSEHTIDNVHFPAEIHVVHYNSKYANISEAASQSDGLVVLGGFIQIGLHENENYEKILAVITDVSIEESNTEIPGFNVRHLLPNKLDRFYRYNGSLTTPPCYQTVNWTIFNDTITVSRKQLKALENTLKAGQEEHLNKNFRAPQLLYGRHVLASFMASSTIKNPGLGRMGERNQSTEQSEGLSRGDILAIAFGVLFGVSLLCFLLYTYQQHRKYTSITKDPRQNVIYKPAMKAEA